MVDSSVGQVYSGGPRRSVTSTQVSRANGSAPAASIWETIQPPAARFVRRVTRSSYRLVGTEETYTLPLVGLAVSGQVEEKALNLLTHAQAVEITALVVRSADDTASVQLFDPCCLFTQVAHIQPSVTECGRMRASIHELIALQRRVAVIVH